jgi:hypothetical protein
VGFSLFKKKGRNLAFSISLMPPIPYPSQETRWRTQGEPLGKIFRRYFDENAIVWYKDNNEELDQIIVTCYGAKFSYEEHEEYAYTGHLVQNLSSEIESFYKQFGTKASIVDVMEPIPKNLQEFATLSALLKANFEKYKDTKLYRRIDYPKKYDFLVIKCKGKGSATEMAEGLLKKFMAEGERNKRISKEHPNIIESLDEKTGKWKTAVVFTDSKNPYTSRDYS